MTLLIAGIVDKKIWMVADTAVTGGKTGLREREFTLKIEVGKIFPALIGFAGGVEHGSEQARLAARCKDFEEALEILREGTKQDGVDFAYGVIVDGEPRLFKVSQGISTPLNVLNIGSAEAFSTFQRVRHGEINPYSPKALVSFVCGAAVDVPDIVSTAAKSMIDTFSARPEHDVGGWAVPYLLQEDGACFVNYAYSVSDPVFDKIVPGSLIEHGTAESGGTTLSVTSLPDDEGVVAYWLQLPGGVVLVRADGECQKSLFRGNPTEFKSAVRESLSRNVDLWVSDLPLGPPQEITIMRGDNGNIDATIANHGNGFTFSVHNLAKEFYHAADISLAIDKGKTIPDGIEINRKTSEEVEISIKDSAITLKAEDISLIIWKLAEIRSHIRPEVSPIIDNSTIMAQIDPIWRTYPSLHPGLPGINLNLRHSGYGWLGFILPFHEAHQLGKWLVDSSAMHLPLSQQTNMGQKFEDQTKNNSEEPSAV